MKGPRCSARALHRVAAAESERPSRDAPCVPRSLLGRTSPHQNTCRTSAFRKGASWRTNVPQRISSPSCPSKHVRTEKAHVAAPLIRSVTRTNAGESLTARVTSPSTCRRDRRPQCRACRGRRTRTGCVACPSALMPRTFPDPRRSMPLTISRIIMHAVSSSLRTLAVAALVGLPTVVAGQDMHRVGHAG